ncbi:MAG: S46 family peptidase [Prevotella sp.]|nr:S46 family peptidase [Prevotella sp.]
MINHRFVKAIAFLPFYLFTSLPLHADEGMWTLYDLPTAVYNQMQAEGFQLPYNDLYYGEQAIKNAVVNFSGYCSGVVVSPDGLVFTNHHCGFEAIRSHSTVEHDYMLNGFYAKTYEEELPNEDMFVSFMVSQQDVTARLERLGLNRLGTEGKEQLIDSLQNAMTDSIKKIDATMHIDIDAFYEGNKYYATTYQDFTDLRLVFTVPKSMGKYGGETDNWMWPRQTCDFSVFRIYANPKTNGPADYSKDNVPYHPKHWAPVSLQGYKPGDFAMTMGYPGSTSRYLSSYGIEQRHMENAIRAQARGVKQDVMVKHMRASEAVRIKYDSKFANSSNYWKNSIGMNKCIDSIGLIQQKREFEHQIQAYVDSTGYLRDSLNFPLMKRLYAESSKNEHDLMYLRESFWNTNVFTARAMTGYEHMDIHGPKSNPKKRYVVYEDNQKTWDEALDKEVLATSLKNYKEHVQDKASLPSFYKTIQTKYNNDYTRYVNDVWSRSLIMKTGKRIYFNTKAYKNDPGVRLGEELNTIMKGYINRQMVIEDSIAAQEKYLCAAKLRMEQDMPHYSDANFTMRLSYGQVGGYDLGGKPSGYYTEAGSMVEKMKRGDKGEIDYVAEPIMHELMGAEDFGPYTDKTTGKMHLCLLTNNDITGGNSGSPLFDGQGRLIGLAFDGNWDSLSSDITFDKHLARTISVDIRYVLYMMDKWGHAERLIKEINPTSPSPTVEGDGNVSRDEN